MSCDEMLGSPGVESRAPLGLDIIEIFEVS